LRLAYSLQFSLPGTAVLRYGEELGMGDNLALPGRDAFRTPMQWDDSPNAGFSTAPAAQLVRPVVNRGDYGYRTVNVTAQRADSDSMLTWFARLISVRRECPQIGDGKASVVDVELPRGVLAHRIDNPGGSMLFLHNLSDRAVTIDLPGLDGVDRVEEMFSDGSGEPPKPDLTGITLAGYGYRWIRLGGR